MRNTPGFTNNIGAAIGRKTTLTVALLLGVGHAALAAAPPAKAIATQAAPSCPTNLAYTVQRLQDEKPQSLCQYAGKVVLVVNTASFCGYTGQYKGLEALYAKYKTKGLVILGFPSNDFEQESGSNQQIADFCENTFGVKFPMFTKTAVSGKDASPLYQQLATTTGTAPQWNFHKYLLARDGRVVANYPSKVAPEDQAFLKEIEKQLQVH